MAWVTKPTLPLANLMVDRGLMADEKRIELEKKARAIAADLPTAVPVSKRPQACVDAARIMARLIDKVGGDATRQKSERARVTHSYCGRLALFLREALDADPKLAEPIKSDADSKDIYSHPEFREIIDSLVHLSSIH